MSRPRRIVPGTVYLLTRRTFERRFFLRPSPKVNQIIEFCLAHAAERCRIELHAFVFLSNHYHLLVSDPHGNLPVFMHWLNEYLAKCINAELGRWESFWAPGSYSAVELIERVDLLKGLLYVLTNPVSSGLVRTMKDWPGVYSTPAQLDAPRRIIERPKGFFREAGSVPAVSQLGVRMPDTLEVEASELERLVTEREEELRVEARRNGRKFLGSRRVLRQSPFDRPGSPEPRRNLNPRLAAKDKWHRIEALQRLKSFLSAYREAWLGFAAGHRDVIFPFGTYAMRVRFGVMCNGP